MSYTDKLGERVLVELRKFMKDNSITCEETVFQADRVGENALSFIGDLCDIVGYDTPIEGVTCPYCHSDKKVILHPDADPGDTMYACKSCAGEWEE